MMRARVPLPPSCQPACMLPLRPAAQEHPIPDPPRPWPPPPDVVLLDNPLSAVDQHTSKHIFDFAIKGLLKDKAVVLIAHQLELLPQVRGGWGRATSC